MMPSPSTPQSRPRFHVAALAASLVMVLSIAAHAIWQNERTLANGEVVLAELAPVDPRSLMQGDYMALRFVIDSHLPSRYEISDANPMPPFALLNVDEARRAQFAGLSERVAEEPGSVAMRICIRDGQPSIGPNAFFFQEGTAATFEAARWGEFRVARDGKALLTSLRDADLKVLGEQMR